MSYKIYKIIADANDGTDRFLCYIGSTIQPLGDRLNSHETHFKLYQANKFWYLTSFTVLSCQWYAIAEIADVGNISKHEAEKLEGIYVKKYLLDPDYIVVNKRIEGRTLEQYYIDNKEKYHARYQAHRTEILIQRNIKHECPCGGRYTHTNKAVHHRTEQHKKIIQSNN